MGIARPRPVSDSFEALEMVALCQIVHLRPFCSDACEGASARAALTRVLAWSVLLELRRLAPRVSSRLSRQQASNSKGNGPSGKLVLSARCILLSSVLTRAPAG